MTAVEHGVGRLRRRHASRKLLVQLVTVVANAHLELDRSIDLADHRRVDESAVQTKLTTTKKFLKQSGHHCQLQLEGTPLDRAHTFASSQSSRHSIVEEEEEVEDMTFV